jgi:hypothetical protein
VRAKGGQIAVEIRFESLEEAVGVAKGLRRSRR